MGQRQDAALRSRIGLAVRLGLQRTRRGDRDKRALLCAQGRRRVLGAEQRTSRVRGQHPVPIGQRQFFQRRIGRGRLLDATHECRYS